MTVAFETVPSLSELYAHAWGQLVRGGRDRRHGFHTATVSTIRNGRPEGRVVVLRQAIPASHALVFHTDTRSAKLTELEQGVAWTLYDARHRLQVRGWGGASIADPATTDARWAASGASARKGYLTETAPGTPIAAWSSGFPEDLAGPVVPEIDRTEVGRPNFTVVTTRLQTYEVLVLRRAGYLRASYRADAGWAGTWQIP